MKIYGSTRSRAARVLWCARELGLDFEHVDIHGPATKEPAFLAVNPNGKVPAIVDGDLTLCESLAINLYLAKKYGAGTLYPKTLEDEARSWQWALWAAGEIEPQFGPIIGFRMHGRGDAAAADAAEAKLQAPFKVLNDALAERDYLLGGSFTVADLNLASVISTFLRLKVDFMKFPNLKAWLDRCVARPAAQG